MSTIYSALNSSKWLSKSYALKFLAVAFVGVHIPLIAIIGLVATGSHPPSVVIITTLVFTLAACVLTLYILYGLLSPLHSARLAMDNFRQYGILPRLPVHYNDEAGRLLQSVQATLQSMDMLIKERTAFSDIIDHDIRVPMTRISAMAEMICRGDTSGLPETFCSQLRKSATEQLQLVRKLTGHLARSQRDMSFRFEPLPLHRVMDNAVQRLRSVYESEGTQFQPAAGTDIRLCLDENAMSEALFLLASEVLRSLVVPPVIHLSTEQIGDEAKLLIGASRMNAITEAFLPDVRSSLDQVNDAIYFARQIIEGHGGKLYHNRDEDGGLRFCISFPVLKI